jgi:hypothetical protein
MVLKTGEVTFIYIAVATFNNAERQDQLSSKDVGNNKMEGIRKEEVETTLNAEVQKFFQKSRSHLKILGARRET